MVLKGKKIVITMRTGTDEYTPFVCGESCVITTTRSKLELTDYTVGNWRKWVPTELEGTIEIEGLTVLYNINQFTSFDVWKAQWDTGKLDFYATMWDGAGNEFVFSCECMIDSNSLSFIASEQFATNSLTLTLNGQPNYTEITDVEPQPIGEFYEGDFSGDNFVVGG